MIKRRPWSTRPHSLSRSWGDRQGWAQESAAPRGVALLNREAGRRGYRMRSSEGSAELMMGFPLLAQSSPSAAPPGWMMETMMMPTMTATKVVQVVCHGEDAQAPGGLGIQGGEAGYRAESGGCQRLWVGRPSTQVHPLSPLLLLCPHPQSSWE